MELSQPNPERDLFVGIYATKLKELRLTPFAQRDIRELERLARQHFHGRMIDIGCGAKPYARMMRPIVA